MHALKQSPDAPRARCRRLLQYVAGLGLALWSVSFVAMAADQVSILTDPATSADCVTLVSTTLLVDPQDYPVVQVAANLFADDVRRVTGKRPEVAHTASGSGAVVIVGTLGKSTLIQKLVDAGKLPGAAQIRGEWETTLTQMVVDPFPGVDRALVIVGSDRRATAYGLMAISQKMGVSPWYWWADVPVTHRDTLAVKVSTPQKDKPGVKYRGIFINDEDWGLQPWAAKTFDPEFMNIGPKTYGKVYELMLRLRLNYLWPAMHGCTTAFAAVPENYRLADKYGIVVGASHCEPMLCNNIHWDEEKQGPWNYSLNRDAIHSYWEDSAKTRGAYEAVWTIGIRGIHDQGMQKPPDALPDQISLMEKVFHDQRKLLDGNVTKQWGPVAQCIVPYKEVLPIYNAGLKVPEDVTLVWVDDNFGYIRRLSSPEERTRPGGAGVYWHLSYYGGPHSYTWLNTTAPALMWEELHKAWENDARTIWVINVGDIKPMEIAIDYFSRLAWNPEGFPFAAQRTFLQSFATENLGAELARPTADLLADYYRLGTIRKPELMERAWAVSLTAERVQQLQGEYEKLLDHEKALAGTLPAQRDAYTELVGLPVRVLGLSGLIFMADRAILEGRDVVANQGRITDLRRELEAAVHNFNTNVAGGKWNHMMPGIQTTPKIITWNSQVRWPWGEDAERPNASKKPDPSPIPENNLRAAANANRQQARGKAHWNIVEGLGPSGRGVALLPASLDSSWTETDSLAPTLEYDFDSKGGAQKAWVDFLPTFRLYPGMKLRVAVSVDNGPWKALEVPGSSGAENEYGPNRKHGVQDNYVRAEIPLPSLTDGWHTFKIRAMDPGAVIDQINLPQR
jgi:hypothetical protein